MDDAIVIDAYDAYVECALWSTSVCHTDDPNEEPAPLDQNFSAEDIDEKTRLGMLFDVSTFIGENWRDLANMDPEQIGHDFWLTREGHGAGFWDRGLGEVGERLTEAAKVYGGFNLYVGDDGKVYGY